MEWSNEQTLEFIELYEKYPILWNSRHPGHKNRNLLLDAWMKIASEFSTEVPVSTLKKKKESLMSTYRSLRKKVVDSEITGTEIDDVYCPSWFAYNAMDRFIRVVRKQRPSLNSEDFGGANIAGRDILTLIEADSEHEDDPATLTEMQNEEIMRTEENRNTFSSAQIPHSRRRRAAHQSADSQVISKHLEKASEVLQSLANKPMSQQKQQIPDGPLLYGQLLASKLRRLSPRARLLLQNKIDNLVFAAELEELDANSTGPKCASKKKPSS